MQHRIAFIQPSRLRVHQILQGTSGQGCGSIGNRLGADLADGANSLGVNKRVLVTDVDRRIYAGNAQLDIEFPRNGGADFQRL